MHCKKFLDKWQGICKASPMVHMRGDQRRLPEVVLRYWESIRGNRPFPCEEDFSPDAIDEMGFWDDCFIIRAHDIAMGKNYDYTYIGANILNAYGEDLTGVSVYAFTSPQAENLALKYHEVLETQVPLTDEGEFLNASNVKVRYRQCLVPFGANNNITMILGAMRYRLYPGG